MKKVIAVLLMALLVVTCAACGSSGEGAGSAPAAEAHIYDAAQVVDVMNGTGTEAIGKCSVIKADSKDVTDEALNDWYFNYVEQNDFNWCVIVYTDQEGMGVYAGSGVVERNTGLEEDTDGSYMLISRDDAIIYTPVDGQLKEIQ